MFKYFMTRKIKTTSENEIYMEISQNKLFHEIDFFSFIKSILKRKK